MGFKDFKEGKMPRFLTKPAIKVGNRVVGKRYAQTKVVPAREVRPIKKESK